MSLYRKRWIVLVLLLVLIPSAEAALSAQAVDDSIGVLLGTPPVFPGHPGVEPFPTPAEEDQAAGLSVDPSNRETSRTFFSTYYENAAQPVINWTGFVATCDAGTTAAAFKDAVLLRINYFRAMAGVPASITWSSTYSDKAQEAALMMAANSALNHDPPTSWNCYSAEGSEGAGHSNLALGIYGWGAISLYMQDPGANNGPVGHRRWVLYPQTQLMGTGDIPGTGLSAANALWVFDDNLWGSRPATREAYVAWPPPGYVPYQVVYPRWSFAYAGADFSQASVTVTRDGQSVPVIAHPYVAGYGENTWVWIMNSLSSGDPWPMPSSDEVYRVTIENVAINNSPQTFTYSVIVFDPNQPGCEYAVLPLTASCSAAGGTGAVTITAASGCGWTSSSNVSWIEITAGDTGSGNGTVCYHVTANLSLEERSGTLNVAGEEVLITQPARARAPLGWLLLLFDED